MSDTSGYVLVLNNSFAIFFGNELSLTHNWIFQHAGINYCDLVIGLLDVACGTLKLNLIDFCLFFLARKRLATALVCVAVVSRWEAPQGKNKVVVAGVRYFDCEPNRRLFTRPEKLTRVK